MLERSLASEVGLELEWVEEEGLDCKEAVVDGWEWEEEDVDLLGDFDCWVLLNDLEVDFGSKGHLWATSDFFFSSTCFQ